MLDSRTRRNASAIFLKVSFTFFKRLDPRATLYKIVLLLTATYFSFLLYSMLRREDSLGMYVEFFRYLYSFLFTSQYIPLSIPHYPSFKCHPSPHPSRLSDHGF